MPARRPSLLHVPPPPTPPPSSTSSPCQGLFEVDQSNMFYFGALFLRGDSARPSLVPHSERMEGFEEEGRETGEIRVRSAHLKKKKKKRRGWGGRAGVLNRAGCIQGRVPLNPLNLTMSGQDRRSAVQRPGSLGWQGNGLFKLLLRVPAVLPGICPT